MLPYFRVYCSHDCTDPKLNGIVNAMPFESQQVHLWPSFYTTRASRIVPHESEMFPKASFQLALDSVCLLLCWLFLVSFPHCTLSTICCICIALLLFSAPWSKFVVCGSWDSVFHFFSPVRNSQPVAYHQWSFTWNHVWAETKWVLFKILLHVHTH